MNKKSSKNLKESVDSKENISTINFNSLNTYQRNQLNILIKNEIEKLVNQTNESFDQRLLETNKCIEEFKNSITTQMETISGIQNEMYNCFRTNKKNFEKLNNIQTIMKNFEEKIENNAKSIENLKNEIQETNKKNEKLFEDNFAIPEIVKEKNNLNNLKDFFNYLINEINNLNTEIKNKEVNMNSCKIELKNIINQIKIKTEHFNEINKDIIKKNYEEINKNFYEKLNEIKEEMPNLDFSNSIYAKELKQEIIEVIKERKDLEIYQNKMKENFNNYFQSLNSKANESVNEIYKYRKEFTKIKKYFIDIIEFLKDVRFQRNINNENNKNYIEKLIFNLTNTSMDNLNEKMIDKINKTKKVDSIISEILVSRNNSYRIKKNEHNNNNLSFTFEKEKKNNNKKKYNIKSFNIKNENNKKIEEDSIINNNNNNFENVEKFDYNNFFTKNQIENMIEDSVKYSLNQTDIKLNQLKNKIDELLIKNSENQNGLYLESSDSNDREKKFILKNVKNFNHIIKFNKDDQSIILLKEKIIKNDDTNLNINNYNYYTNNNSQDKISHKKRILSTLPSNYSNYNDKIKKIRKNNSYNKMNNTKIEKLKIPKI
jgi:hypothetical protein